jgi:hypothetical protein
MLTIFTIPKTFEDKHIRIIQENALKSWQALGKGIKVVLIGNDEGVAKTARRLGLIHLPFVAVNQHGTPLLNSAFDLARNVTKNKYLCYINADILLLSGFLNIFKYIPKRKFLVVGQRWDLDIKKHIDFKDKNWQEKIREKLKKEGKIHRSLGKAGSDYFIFEKNSFTRLPAFAVGRVGWDNWVIYKARHDKMKVIDATPLIRIIHQDHDYLHQINRGKDKRGSAEGSRNIALAGGEKHLFNLEDCNFKLTKKGLKKNIPSFWQILKYIKNTPEILPGKNYFWWLFKPLAGLLLWFKKAIISLVVLAYKNFK